MGNHCWHERLPNVRWCCLYMNLYEFPRSLFSKWIEFIFSSLLRHRFLLKRKINTHMMNDALNWNNKLRINFWPRTYSAVQNDYWCQQYFVPHVLIRLNVYSLNRVTPNECFYFLCFFFFNTKRVSPNLPLDLNTKNMFPSFLTQLCRWKQRKLSK